MRYLRVEKKTFKSDFETQITWNGSVVIMQIHTTRSKLNQAHKK